MDAVEEIKSRLSIEDVVGRHVDLKRSGASFKGLCPFHQEKTPSFYVTPARGTYHCFGCGKGGDIFSFEMEMEKLPFPEALQALAGQAGVTLPERGEHQPSLKNRLVEANEAASRFFKEALVSEQGIRARRYLDERQFGQEAWEMFELGYAPHARDSMAAHLRRAGFDDRILLAAGLVMQDESGANTRDRFRGRLMFPIRDLLGRMTGFGARALESDQQPKYLNSPQTEIFDKSSVLYGVHRGGDAIKDTGRAVLVEGYLDALRAHLRGYRNVVASLGTAVTAQQLTALTRLTGTVVLALDPDPAGQSAAARTSLNALAEVTKQRGRVPGTAGALELRIALLAEGDGDPDELIRDHPDRWQKTVEESIPAFEFFFTKTLEDLNRSSDAWRQEAIDRLLPPIQQLAASAGWQATWLQRLATETGVDPRALQRSMSVAQGTRPKQRQAVPSQRGQDVVTGTTARGLAEDPRLGIEQALLSLLLKLVVLPPDVACAVSEAPWERPEHRMIVEALVGWRESQNYDFLLFQETVPDALRAYAEELQAKDTPLPDEGKFGVAVASHLERLRSFRLKAELTRAYQVLPELSGEDRTMALATVGQLLNQIRDLDANMEKLSRLTSQSCLMEHRA